MRNILASTLVAYASKPEFVFLTGDLGFMALEPVQQAAGSRFINAGVAEQNMVSVAAGMARVGLKPWVYSIAPFVYARAFEQIRNDVCYHKLPVFLVGNGGGYAYGVMGGTHHALEDYGALLTLRISLRTCQPLGLTFRPSRLGCTQRSAPRIFGWDAMKHLLILSCPPMSLCVRCWQALAPHYSSWGHWRVVFWRHCSRCRKKSDLQHGY